MRLFVALELNSKVVANLTELVRRLSPISPVRWVSPQHMHVTLKYIGDFPERQLKNLVSALNEVKLNAPLTVPLAGLGYFPNADNPRVMWVGAENTTTLRKLASGIDAELLPLGVIPDVRPYQPHLTLGRIDEDGDLKEMHHAIEDLPSREFGIINPDRFVLFESSVTASGSVFRKVEEFQFFSQPAESPAGGRQFVNSF